MSGKVVDTETQDISENGQNLHTMEFEMPKTWEELTQEEKIEDLRRDVKRLIDSLHSANANTSRSLASLDSRVSRLSREIQTATPKLNRPEKRA